MSLRPFIKESLFLLNLCGIHPYAHDNFSHLRMSIFLFIIITMTINILLDSILNWNGFGTIDSLAVFSSAYQIVMKTITVIMYKRHLKQILYKMERFWKIDKYGSDLKNDIENIYMTAKNSAKFMALIIILLVPLYLGQSFISKIRKLPYKAYYPTDLNKSPDYELAFAYHILFLICCCFTLIGADGLFLSLIIHIICELKVIKKSLEILKITPEIKGDDQENLNDVNRIVDHHNLILSCIHDLREIYSVLLLHVYFFDMTCLCMGLLGIISSGFPPTLEAAMKYGIYSIFFLTQLFFYCFTGNYLTAEHASISDVIYNTAWWIKTQPKFRRACQMIIQRSNKTEELTAGGMFSLSLDSFRKVIKAALSFFTLVKALSEH